MIWVGEAPNDLTRDRENSPVIKMPASPRRTSGLLETLNVLQGHFL